METQVSCREIRHCRPLFSGWQSRALRRSGRPRGAPQLYDYYTTGRLDQAGRPSWSPSELLRVLDTDLMILVPPLLYIVLGLLHELFGTLLVALQEHTI